MFQTNPKTIRQAHTFTSKVKVSLIVFIGVSLISNIILAQEQADRAFLWNFGDSGLGFWKKAYNCGNTDQPGGQDNTKTVRITFGSTEQQRFNNSPSVKFWTDASVLETCNQNNTAERAELNAEAPYRSFGAKEGETVWFGWSDKWTDIDDSHTTTFLQFRNNCGSGGPGTQLVMSPGKKLKIKTYEQKAADIGTIQEDKWYDFVAEIKYSKSNNGYIKVWMFEGNQEFPNHAYTTTPSAQILNTKTMRPDDACPHLRWGVYRHESADKLPGQIKAEDRVVIRYMGPLRMELGGNLGATGFEAVVPRNISLIEEPAYNSTPPEACTELTNLAFNKQTNQSSIHSKGTSNKAVDAYTGPTASTLDDDGPTHTLKEPNPWWEVDLGGVYTISQITYKGRTDCCQNRLANAHILISQQRFKSTSLTDHLNNPEIWSTKRTDFPAPSITLNTGNVRGRYIRVQLEANEYLSLSDFKVMGCESPDQEQETGPEPEPEPEEPEEPADPPVEPCDSPSNVALEKAAQQSSTYGNGSADRAVDRDERTDQGPWRTGGVTHTKSDQNAWWEVDLGSSFDISKIEYTGRTDCCKERLENAYVMVSNEPFGTNPLANSLANPNIWHSKQTSFPNPKISLETGSILGRYVRIQLEGKASLSLADVKVFGCTPTDMGPEEEEETEEPTEAPVELCEIPDNVALQKTARQSSIYANGSADRAVDSDVSTDKGPWKSGGVTHTRYDQNAWWEVDLGATYTLSEISYSGRTDCCQDRLENAYVMVSEQAFGNNTLATSLANSQIWRSFQSQAPNPGITIPLENIQGRYVRIQLEGRAHLSLADVQVKGCLTQTSTQTASSSGFRFAGSEISTAKEELIVYPNVADKHLFVDLTTNSRISLTDLNGVPFIEKVFSTGLQSLDLSHIPEGMYVVVRESAEGVQFEKIVVRH